MFERKQTAGDAEFGTPLAIEDVRELKSAGDEGWQVSGYVSTYHNKDWGGDVVLPGAFDETLAAGHKTRFLYSHDPRQPLGKTLSLKSDERGLFGRFKISKTRLGEEVRQLLLDEALDSFSIGFITKDADYDGDGTRLLKSVHLIENSVVALPMNVQALVTGVKTSAPTTPETASPPVPISPQTWDELVPLLEKFLRADPEQPTEQLWERVLAAVHTGVEAAKALYARRRDEQRELSERVQMVFATSAERLDDELKTLRALGSDRPSIQTEAETLRVRRLMMRRRLEAAGILDKLPTGEPPVETGAQDSDTTEAESSNGNDG